MLKNPFITLTFLLMLANQAGAQTTFEVGDTVLTWWEAAKLYYVGTIVERDNTIKGGGCRVIFADGDQAVVPFAQVHKMDIAVGSQVLAMWSDGRLYPGKVAKIVGGALFIHFNDGDKGWTSWAGIARQ